MRFDYRTAAAVLLCLGVAGLHAADWPHWRGPDASGVAADPRLPVRWSETQNLAWKAPLAGVGVSTPIVSGDRVFVTSQTGESVRRAGNHPRLVQGGGADALGERPLEGRGEPTDRTTFVVEAFARGDGRRLWQQRIEAEGDLTPVHDKHNLTTPSPVTDGHLVFAWFGTGQIVALTTEGRIAWQRHLGREIAPFDIYTSRGYRSGPYLALRPGGRGDVTRTHVLWSVPTGAPYVSSLLYYNGVLYMANDVGVLTAIDAATGERLWQERVDGVFSASPVAGGGHVYFVSEKGDTIVLEAGRSPRIVARNPLGERAIASPAISRGQIFIRTDGHLFCVGGADS